MDDKEIARFFDCCEPPGQRKLNTKLSRKARQALIDAVVATGLKDKTVLEIGCGPGDLIRELVRAGALGGTGIDLAEGTLDQARQKTAEAGLTDRIQFRAGNGASAQLDPHDIVVLDKVICCYPDWEAMVDNTAGAATSVYGFVIPRSDGINSLLTNAFIKAGNLFLRLRKCGCRSFVHDYRKIDAQLKSKGFKLARYSPGPVWVAAIYVRG